VIAATLRFMSAIGSLAGLTRLTAVRAWPKTCQILVEGFAAVGCGNLLQGEFPPVEIRGAESGA